MARTSRKARTAASTLLGFEPLEDRNMLAVFTVTNLNDAFVDSAGDAPGTLRQAIFDANATVAEDTIEFQTGLAGALTLTNGQMIINRSLVINGLVSGLGENLITIDANEQSRIFHVTSGAASLEINDLNLTNGHVDGGGGGAIRFVGNDLTLSHVVFSENTALDDEEGGGALYASIMRDESLLIEDCIFDQNSAGTRRESFDDLQTEDVDGSNGGAVSLYLGNGAECTITQTTFMENWAFLNGGALFVRNGSNFGPSAGNFTLRQSVVSGNTAFVDSGGGALILHRAPHSNYGAGSTAIDQSLFQNNLARESGGGILIYAHAENLSTGTSKVIIEDSTISNNTAINNSSVAAHLFDFALYGARIHSGGGVTFIHDLVSSSLHLDASIVNSTISGNVSGNAGGLLLRGDIQVRHSTIVENVAGRFAPIGFAGAELYPGSGGGVTIHRATGTFADTIEPPENVFALPSFSDSIVARNIHENPENFNAYAPNIQFSFYSSFGGGVPGGISLYTNPGTSEVDTLADVIITSLPEWPLLTEQEKENIFKRYYIDDFIFDYSIIDDRRGPLLHLDPNEPDRVGKTVAFDASSVYIEIPKYTGDPAFDPLLAPLADNGGPALPGGNALLTHALKNLSPAVDAGDPLITGEPDFDERGTPFVRVYNDIIDIGAFERQPDPDCDADFDGDNFITGLDFLIWQRNFGSTSATQSQGDADGDMDVDADDLACWEQDYGLEITAPLVDALTEPAELGKAFIPNNFAGLAPIVSLTSPNPPTASTNLRDAVVEDDSQVHPSIRPPIGSDQLPPIVADSRSDAASLINAVDQLFERLELSSLEFEVKPDIENLAEFDLTSE